MSRLRPSLSLLIINVEEIATFKSSQLFIAFYHVILHCIFYLLLCRGCICGTKAMSPNGHTLIVVGKHLYWMLHFVIYFNVSYSYLYLPRSNIHEVMMMTKIFVRIRNLLRLTGRQVGAFNQKSCIRPWCCACVC